MKLSSLAALEAADIRLADRISISMEITMIAGHFGLPTEVFDRDGLGPFYIVVFASDTIGHWALIGSKAMPSGGATILSDPKVVEARVLIEVRRCLAPLEFDAIQSSTGYGLA